MADAPAVKSTTPEEQIPEPPRKRSALEIGIYIVFGVICAVFLAFFIKGWIDADDVEVSPRQADRRSDVPKLLAIVRPREGLEERSWRGIERCSW